MVRLTATVGGTRVQLRREIEIIGFDFVNRGQPVPRFGKRPNRHFVGWHGLDRFQIEIFLAFLFLLFLVDVIQFFFSLD